MNYFTGLFQTFSLTIAYALLGYALLFFNGSLKKIRPDYRIIFLSLFMGVSVAVTVYSVFISRGKSVHIILLPAMIYLIYTIRKWTRDNTFEVYPAYKIIFVCLAAIVLLYSYCYWGYSNNYEVADYVYYSKISYYLAKTGCENDYHLFNTLNTDYNGVTPYHYFDLWFNAINRFALPMQSTLNTFLLVTPAILLIAVFFGFLSIYESKIKVDGFGILLSIAIIFFGGVFLPLYEKVPFLATFQYCFDPYSVHNIAKYTPTVLFIIAGYIFLRNISLSSGLLVFGLIAVISVVNVPVSGFAMVATFLFFRFSKMELKLSLQQLCWAMLPVLLVVIFYYVFANKLVVRGGTNASGLLILLHNFSSKSFLLQKINIIAGSALSTGTVYLFLLPALYLVFLKQARTHHAVNTLFFVWLLAACVGGALAWSFMSPKINAVQPFYHVLKAFPVLIFIAIIHLEKPTWKYGTFLLVLLFSGIHVYKAVNENLRNTNKTSFTALYNFASKYVDLKDRVGFIKDSTEYNSTSSYYSTCYCSGLYLCTNNDPLFAINISDYNIPTVTDSVTRQINMEGLKLGLFYRYVEKQKKEDRFVSLEQSQLEFIRKYKIRTLVLSPHATLPVFLSKYADTIVVVPGWKEKIVRLKY